MNSSCKFDDDPINSQESWRIFLSVCIFHNCWSGILLEAQIVCRLIYRRGTSWLNSLHYSHSSYMGANYRVASYALVCAIRLCAKIRPLQQVELQQIATGIKARHGLGRRSRSGLGSRGGVSASVLRSRRRE